jgi:hypothetical protein
VSRFRTCDFCGHDILAGEHSVTMSVRFDHPSDVRLDSIVGDYHFSRQQPCYQQVTEAVLLTHEFGGAIEQIPVTSSQSVAQKRRRHTRPPLDPSALPQGDDGAEQVTA